MSRPLGPSKPCPCGSGSSYGDCCRPLHEGRKEASTAEALMRSRYSAFALSEVGYLIATLADEHEDRRLDPAVLTASLREVCRTSRFMGLRVLEASEVDAESRRATVRFHARIFSGGRDRSFEEISEFVRENGAWRYLAGTPSAPNPS